MITRNYVCKACPFPCNYVVYLDESEEGDNDTTLDHPEYCILNKHNTAKWELVR